MFSEHVKKVDRRPLRVLFIVAAGLVFLCQLVALVFVANGQVEKAHLRQAVYSSAQVEIADCSKSYSGVARSQCIEQVNAAINLHSTHTQVPDVSALVMTPSLVDQDVTGGATRTQTSNGEGFIAAAFVSR